MAISLAGSSWEPSLICTKEELELQPVLTATVQVKSEIMELVTFLRDPDRFLRMGARTPAGVLLCGAPGTGTPLLQTHIGLGWDGMPGLPLAGATAREERCQVGCALY